MDNIQSRDNTQRKLSLPGKAFVLAFCLSAMVCTVLNQQKKIAVNELKDMMEKGLNFVLLDVRTTEEYANGRISGAISFPVDSITRESAQELLKNKKQTIIVYCQTGRRSARAASKLGSFGYGNVLDMGGLESWPFELVSD